MTVGELKEECTRLKVSTGGKKTDLVGQLKAHQEKPGKQFY